MNPVNFTNAAVEHIKKILMETPNSKGFRLSIKKTGCSGYAYVPEVVEKAQAGDIEFLVQDNLPFYLDPSCFQYINNLTIDYTAEPGEGLKQKRLVFVNPNETGRCGCGESFTIE